MSEKEKKVWGIVLKTIFGIVMFAIMIGIIILSAFGISDLSRDYNWSALSIFLCAVAISGFFTFCIVFISEKIDK